jgi:type VI protein secretion system component Hcp
MVEFAGRIWQGRIRMGAVAVAAAALGVAAVSVLSPITADRVQAAPVPAAQASCPPPVDPRPVAQNTTSYLRLDGVTGDVQAAGFVGQIGVTGYRTGVLGGGSGLCGAAAGVPAFDPIVVEKRIDRSTVALHRLVATGLRTNSARLTVTATSGGRTIATYDLTDVTIQAARQVNRPDAFTEEVALGFTRITWTYFPLNPDGTAGPAISACFNRATNAQC